MKQTSLGWLPIRLGSLQISRSPGFEPVSTPYSSTATRTPSAIVPRKTVSPLVTAAIWYSCSGGPQTATAKS